MEGNKGHYTKLTEISIKNALRNAGRPRIFDTAEEFLNAFQQYVEWCEENPIAVKSAYKKKKDNRDEGETRMTSDLKRIPLSERGFAAFVGAAPSWLKNSIDTLTAKENKSEEEIKLLDVQTCVRNIIYNQQYEGAAIGDFNAILIMRNLGMNDSVDVTSNGETLKGTTPVINIIRDTRKAGAMDEDGVEVE